MDAASLRVAQHLSTPVDALEGLHVVDHTALLVEAQCESADGARRPGGGAERGHSRNGWACINLAKPSAFSTDPRERAQAWLVRKGLYTAVAGARPAGSTALLEDVVVPMPRLTDTVADLQHLCGRHGYDDAVIFGHAKDANLHFMINPDLRDPAQPGHLRAVLRRACRPDSGRRRLAEGRARQRANHGAVRRAAVRQRNLFVMRSLEGALRPGRRAQSGVIITDDARIHLR